MTGLLLVEQLRGRLGLPALDDAQAAALVPGERTLACTGPLRAAFDREAFLLGVADMNQVEMTPAGLQRFLESDALRVDRESLPLLFHALGRVALPFPWSSPR